MDDYTTSGAIEPGFRNMKFSLTEIRDIIIAVVVLSISFTIILARANPTYFSQDNVTNIACWVLVSFILVIASFLLHELGHKYVAQRMGAWSEFRASPIGLGLCLVICLVSGFLFAAPGAVYIRGDIDKDMYGKISLAGPVVNIILGFIALGVSMITTGRVGAIFFLLAHLNGFLAVFNMLPLFQLDGLKVLKWNIPVYIVTMAVAALLLYLAW